MGHFGEGSSHQHGRGENSVPASLEPAQQPAVSRGSCTQGLQGWRGSGLAACCNSCVLLPHPLHACGFHPAADDPGFKLAHLCDGRGVGWVASPRESRAVSVTGQWVFASCTGRARDLKDRD